VKEESQAEKRDQTFRQPMRSIFEITILASAMLITYEC